MASEVLHLDRPGSRQHDLLGARLVSGDVAAFDEIFKLHYRAAVAVARRYVRDRLAAEDIAQESFLALWRNRCSYRQERGSVRTWLITITHHRAIDATRRARARPQNAAVPLEDAHSGGATDAIADEAERRELRRVVRAAIASLPFDQRQVLGLSAYGGLTQREIALRTGAPLGTVKGRSRLAISKLRHELAA